MEETVAQKPEGGDETKAEKGKDEGEGSELEQKEEEYQVGTRRESKDSILRNKKREAEVKELRSANGQLTWKSKADWAFLVQVVQCSAMIALVALSASKIWLAKFETKVVASVHEIMKESQRVKRRNAELAVILREIAWVAAKDYGENRHRGRWKKLAKRLEQYSLSIATLDEENCYREVMHSKL